MLVLFVFLVSLLVGKCVLSSGSGEEEQNDNYHKNNYPANINSFLRKPSAEVMELLSHPESEDDDAHDVESNDYISIDDTKNNKEFQINEFENNQPKDEAPVSNLIDQQETSSYHSSYQETPSKEENYEPMNNLGLPDSDGEKKDKIIIEKKYKKPVKLIKNMLFPQHKPPKTKKITQYMVIHHNKALY